MRSCCLVNNLVLGVLGSEDPPTPPVLSDYCVQWGAYADQFFFPCGENTGVNGVFNSGAICGGYVDIADFVAAGNLFRYSIGGSLGSWYVQVITPAANGLVADFGYIEYDIFGTPSGPVPIGAIQEVNCILNCYSVTFDVDDVNTQGMTAFNYNGGVEVDWIPIAFSDPGHDAHVLSSIIGYLEPSATLVSSYVGNTVTVTIQTIMVPVSLAYGAPGGPDFYNIMFTPCP